MSSRFGFNSTIQRKQKPCKSCGRPSYIFSKGRCEQCSRIENTNSRMDRVSDQIIGDDKLKDLIEDADRVVSLFVRLKDADENGLVKCYTCNEILPYQEMQAGHFIKRQHLHLRWDVSRNLRPQCEGCNCYKSGNIPVYFLRLENDYPGLPDILQEEMNIIYKPSRQEISAIISEYSSKVKSLLKKINKPE